ncbi:MAG: GGDEF domain-containing protein, partial [Sulfurimonadaceae bacterium]|nr:GGDEF domain-containing protein [Sulfurimonadaceae bacterium]
YPDYLRSRVSLISLLIAAVILLFFSIINYTLGDKELALIEMMAMVMMVAIYIDYYRNKNLERLSSIVVGIMYALFIPLTLLTQNEDYTLIWTIFFPIFAILVKGRKKGLFHIALFYVVVMGAALYGIGEWQDGQWNFRSFMRFLLASAMMVMFMYLIDMIKDYIYNKVRELVAREEQHIKVLKQLSNTDPLTQLYNRRYLKEVFPCQFNMAKRHNFVMGFFILDIDYFKQFNDAYGHIEGDNALKKVAAIFQAQMRRGTDSAYRLGGEEFAGLVIADSAEQVIAQANRIREAVEAEAIPHKQTGKMTVSIGVRIVQKFNGESFDTVYAKADNALYQAKEKGRNSVIVNAQ